MRGARGSFAPGQASAFVVPLTTLRAAALLLAAVYVLAASAFGSEAPGGKCCVWRVTNVPVPFYLVGTLHSLSSKDYPLPSPYEQALRDSKRLVFEVDPDPRGDYSKKFAQASTYPKGDNIQHHIHPQAWAFLYKSFRISNYDGHSFWMGEHYVEGIEKLRPWAIAFNVWGIHGYSDVFGAYGVDHHFHYQGRRLGKETAGLESEKEHIEVLRGMADMDAEILLLDTLVKGDKRRDEFNELRAAWRRGDVAALAAREERDRKQNLGASLRLLDYRNLRWIPRIEAEMKTGKPTSIVAGTAHFCGPNSVVEMLEKRGYKIEQL